MTAEQLFNKDNCNIHGLVNRWEPIFAIIKNVSYFYESWILSRPIIINHIFELFLRFIFFLNTH